MAVQYDARGNGKHYFGYYWDRESKKKVSVGMFHTREEAEAAVAVAFHEKYPHAKERKTCNEPITRTRPKPKKDEAQEKKPINLKFGLWKTEDK